MVATFAPDDAMEASNPSAYSYHPLRIAVVGRRAGTAEEQGDEFSRVKLWAVE